MTCMSEHPSEQTIFIYCTFPDTESARQSAKNLLEKKLIACANIFPNMTSLYWWKDQIEESHEIAIILKTEASLFEACQKEIQTNHPYNTPCILELPINRGNEAYLTWIKQAVVQT